MRAFQTNLAVLLVLFTPFIWGFLTRVGGLLVRPSDLIVAVFYALVILRGRIHAPFPVRVFYCLIGAVLFSLLVSSIVTGAGGAWAVKALALIPIPLLIYDTLARNDFQIPGWAVVLPLAVFGIAILPIIYHLGESITRGVINGNLQFTLYVFWHDTFETNPFGSENLEIYGQSARNGFSLGAIAVVLFAYGFWRNGPLRTVAIVFFSVIALAAFSRTGWATLGFLVLTVLLVRRAYWLVGGVFLAMAFTGAALRQTAYDRLVSRVGRIEDLPHTLDTFGANILFGDPTAVDPRGHIIMHNVPLSLGANYGIFAFVFALALTIFTFVALVLLYRAAFQAPIGQRRPLIAAAVAAFACTAMPHVSSAGTNLYTMGEYAMLGLVLAGLAIRQTLRAARPGRPERASAMAAPLSAP